MFFLIEIEGVSDRVNWEEAGMLKTIAIDLIIGLLTGCLSGCIVYCSTKKREKKYQTYYYWSNFLFHKLETCEICIPVEALNLISEVGDKDSTWHEAIVSIINDTNPYGHEDITYSDEEERLCNNILTAIQELEKWKKKNKLK